MVPAGENDALDDATRRLEDLELRWSRFLARSELSRVNSHAGVPVIVSRETFEVIALAVDAWHRTAGLFDPTVHDALVTGGYDRPFAEMPTRVSGGDRTRPAPTPASIHLDEALNAITLPPGVRLDLGGIGKGAAADLIVAEAAASGVRGICVNIGGDVRVWGEGPESGAWSVVLRCPGSMETRTIDLVDGAVCTSTRLRRRWVNDTGPTHHIIEPCTGRAAETGLASVGVVAARAAPAEVLAKAAFLLGIGPGADLLRQNGVRGALVADDGRVLDVGEPAFRTS